MPPKHRDITSPITEALARFDRDAEREDRIARMRGFDDADHFLRLATTNFGDWVWREYRAIFQNKRMPDVPGGI